MPKPKTAKHEIIETKAAAPSYEVAPHDQSAERLIAQAIERGTPVDTMERLLAMRRELKAEWAKEEYDKAMAAFQAECPVIKKNKQAKDGEKLLYKYAPIDSIVEQVQDLISKHGFSYSFDTEEDENTITPICIVTHKAGHSKSSRFKIPSKGGTSIMSGPQKAAAALTFGKRYAFCNAFGIMTGDEDVDANKGVVEAENKPKPAPKKPVAKPIENGTLVQIRNMLEVQKVDPEKFKAGLIKFTGKDNLEALTEDDAQKMLKMLRTKLDSEMKTTKAQVDAAMPGPVVSDTIQKRTMECKTQEEATQILTDMKSMELSEVKRTALTNILKTKGFTV